MKKRIRNYALVAILGITLAVPGVGLAYSGMGFRSDQRGSPGGWMMSGGMGYGMMGPGMMGTTQRTMGMGPDIMFGQGVTLTDEQQEKFADIQNRFLKESVKPQADLIQARAALQSLLLEPTTKEAAIEEQVQKSAAAQARLFALRVQAEREIANIYTKEQRDQIARGSTYGPMGMTGTAFMGNPCVPGTPAGQTR